MQRQVGGLTACGLKSTGRRARALPAYRAVGFICAGEVQTARSWQSKPPLGPARQARTRPWACYGANLVPPGEFSLPKNMWSRHWPTISTERNLCPGAMQDRGVMPLFAALWYLAIQTRPREKPRALTLAQDCLNSYSLVYAYQC